MNDRALLLACAALALACGRGAGSPAPAPEGNPPPPPPPYVELPPPGPAWPLGNGAGELPSPEQRLRRVELELAPADLAALELHPDWDVMYPARVRIDGREALGAARYRGASARTRPQKSWRIDLDPGYALEGRDRFALIAEYDDAAKLVERFAVDLYRALGLPVPFARFVNLYVNGEHQGVLLDMERVGGEYLALHGHEHGASIYRCGGRNCEMKRSPRAESYQQDFSKTRNETLPWDDLDRFLEVIGRTDDADLERRLGAVMDLDAYLGNLAGDALISNFILEDARPYWIHELGRDVWTYVPWDLNNARPYWTRTLAPDQPITGTSREARVFTIYDDAVKAIYDVRVNERAGQKPTWSVLATRIWDHPALRGRLLAKLEAALQTTFTPERVGPYLEALWAVAGPEILADPYVDRARAETEPARLVEWVRARRANLLAKLPALRAHGGGPLVLNELGLPTATEPGYVELHNRGDAELDLSGVQVTDDLRVPAKYALPAGTVIPPRGHLVLVADGAAAPGHLPFVPSSSGGELGIFPPGAIYAPYDLVYFGPRAAGSAYGRTSDGAEAWANVPRTPGVAN